MGLYNLVFKTDSLAPVVIAMLERHPEAFGRFRDAWIELAPDQPSGLRLVVYTRNGGGNREHYMPKFSADPLYLGDADDDYDSTYAFIYFRVPDPVPAELLANCPEDLREPTVLLARLRELAKPPVDMRARWESALKAMERP